MVGYAGSHTLSQLQYTGGALACGFALAFGGCSVSGESTSRPSSNSKPAPVDAPPNATQLDDADGSLDRATTTSAPTAIVERAERPAPEFPAIDLGVDDPHAALERILRALGRTPIDSAQWSIPNAAFEPGALETLTRLAGTDPRLETTRDDGVRADVIVTAADHRVIATLVRWEGEWRLGAIVELLAAPPLVIVDAERGV